MEKVKLHINGLSHYYLKDESVRDEFLKVALGEPVRLNLMKYHDEPKVTAIVMGLQVGHVERSDIRLAKRALDGMKCDCIYGTIVDANRDILTVEVEIDHLAEADEVLSPLFDWEYTGPIMPLNNDVQVVGLMFKYLREMLLNGCARDMELNMVIDTYCKLTQYDYSRESIEERRWLIEYLEKLDSKRYAKALKLLHDRGRVLGSDEGIAAAGHYLKHVLPTTSEAKLMKIRKFTSIDYHELREEAKKLPCSLFDTWQKDEVSFARTLYIYKPKREELRRLLSCLIWLDLHKTKLFSDLEDLADKCKKSLHVNLLLGNHFYGGMNSIYVNKE